MDKTSKLLAKDPDRQELAHKKGEKHMNWLKGNILNDARKGWYATKKVGTTLVKQAMMITALPPALSPLLPLLSLDLVMLTFIALVQLLYLLWILECFLHTRPLIINHLFIITRPHNNQNWN